jgi:hypothetical protein
LTLLGCFTIAYLLEALFFVDLSIGGELARKFKSIDRELMIIPMLAIAESTLP